MAKAKAATAINLIIVFLPCEPSTRDFYEGMSNKLNHRRTQFNMVGCRTHQAADENDVACDQIDVSWSRFLESISSVGAPPGIAAKTASESRGTFSITGVIAWTTEVTHRQACAPFRHNAEDHRHAGDPRASLCRLARAACSLEEPRGSFGSM
jgi:hypothetical protein